MKIVHHGDTLNVSEVSELSARNCERFRSELEPLLPQSRSVRIDLSQTDFMDCRGVSALLALQRLAGGGLDGCRMTVLNPHRCVRRIFGLTGADHIVPVDEALPEPLQTDNAALLAFAAALNPAQRMTLSVEEPTIEMPAAPADPGLMPPRIAGPGPAAPLAGNLPPASL